MLAHSMTLVHLLHVSAAAAASLPAPRLTSRKESAVDAASESRVSAPLSCKEDVGVGAPGVRLRKSSCSRVAAVQLEQL